MFERTLADLIRGLRACSKQDEAAFIAKAVDEIRNEVKSKDMELKAAAILKLAYLDMMGYDMSWASFHVVEVMSSSKIHLKAVGYLAAVQSFKTDTDVLMLTTNTLKKDIASPNPTDIATALDGLSHFLTPDIARDLSLDIIAMLNHSRPKIRKRAVLIIHKVFEKYPDVILRSMTRLREKLEDPDPGVVSTTVGVLCELARRNPQDYLPLAPQLFDLLTNSSNNWMLIKLIKLLGALTPHEPRLVKKLHKPISELIATTPAVSLLYECVHTCIIGGMLQGHTTTSDSLAKTCVNKLSAFLSDADQNLKYIALLAMAKIVPTHPHLVAVHQDGILASLDDHDLSIRMRALDLVSSMATPDNIRSIVQKLLSHLVPPQNEPVSQSTSLPSATDALTQVATSSSLAPAACLPNPNSDPAYRRALSLRVISICSQFATESYGMPVADADFDYGWYISVLVDLTYVSPAQIGIGTAIRDQLLDVAIRVTDPDLRQRTVTLMARLLGDENVLEMAVNDDDKCAEELEGGGEEEVLWAAAWICGEFCRELPEPQNLFSLLLESKNVRLLPERTQSAYLQCALKLFGHWAAELSSQWDDTDQTAVAEVLKRVNNIHSSLDTFARSEHIEVQERAANMLELFAFVKADVSLHQTKALSKTTNTTSQLDSELASDPAYPKSLFLIQPLHARRLYPIPLSTSAPSTSQIRPSRLAVPIPEGLDLESWIVPLPKSAARAEGGGENLGHSHDLGSSGRKKGKQKAIGDGTAKKSKKKVQEAASSGAITLSHETEEERVARAHRKAQLAEERRNDPFYLVDDHPPQPADNDVDSIPVVKLDLSLPSPSTSKDHEINAPVWDNPNSEAISSTPALRDLKPRGSYTSVRSAPPTPIIDSTRESSPASTPSSSMRTSSILNSSLLAAARKAATPLSGGFAPYEIDEDEAIPPREREVGVSTPEPIKVTKVKKKKGMKSKSTKVMQDM